MKLLYYMELLLWSNVRILDNKQKMGGKNEFV